MIHRPRVVAALAGLTTLVLLAAGCAEQDPTGVELRPRDGLQVGSVAQILSAPTTYDHLQYAGLIGPQGGSITFGIGRIEFPAGAVTAVTPITATVSGNEMAVTFSPHGLVFPTRASPQLRLNLAGVSVEPERIEIIYVNSYGIIAEVLPTTVQVEGSVSTPISHFSTYAMGAH